jgi:uncharacterized protein (UPF0276 family)
MTATTPARAVAAGSVPARAGIGLRADHYFQVLDEHPAVAWFEVHSENYFGAGGRPLDCLERIRAHYPLSLHGVGLSLGSSDPLNQRHLGRLRDLIARCEPGLVSDHLSWSSVGGRYLNDLLPLPQTRAAARHAAGRIARVQDALRREILIENLSSYLEFAGAEMPEAEFLVAVAERAGCRILLDVNNVYVSSVNHGFDPYRYLDAVPPRLVAEIHLAGHTRRVFEDGEILIDTHNALVCAPVWALYRHALGRLGPVPTLIEWDKDLPPLAVLQEEAARAQDLIDQCQCQTEDRRHAWAA